MRKNLVRIVISALIVIAAVLIFIFKPDFTKAAWYNSSWDYRKRLTINGTTDGVQTNYQMKLTVYKSAGSDSGHHSSHKRGRGAAGPCGSHIPLLQLPWHP